MQMISRAYTSGMNAGKHHNLNSRRYPENPYSPQTFEYAEWETGFDDGIDCQLNYIRENTPEEA